MKRVAAITAVALIAGCSSAGAPAAKPSPSYDPLKITANQRAGEQRAHLVRNLFRTPPMRTVTYTLTGTARGADITYTDDGGSTSQQSSLAVPLVTDHGRFHGLQVHARSGDFVQFSAQNATESGTLVCQIHAEGRVLNQAFASGAFTIASCAATVP